MRRALVTLALLCTVRGVALAGPPYETDDPAPTDYRNYEIYFHVDYYRVGQAIQGDVGTLEVNYGLFPNTQFSVSLPTVFAAGTIGSGYGLGDIGIGLKYRFIQETQTSPQISFYPQITLATGNPMAGLGEGHGTLLLPLWAQKSIGPWTFFGGGGVIFDRQPGQPASAWQDGLAITRDVSAATNVGIEIYHSGAYAFIPAHTDIGVGYIGDIGAYHAIVFSGGPSLGISAAAHAYLGYEWRLGPSDARE